MFPLAEPDEPRYAEVAREMLIRGDWITPHLNYVPFVEKPPLVMWGSALSFKIFGVNELAARLPSLAGAAGTIVLIFILARDMYGRATALLAAAIFATAPFTAVLSQTLTLDITLTFFVALALTAVWFGARGHRAWYCVAYVAVALGILTKGPVAAVLVGATAIPTALLSGGPRALRAALDPLGLVLFGAIAVPWFVLVAWRNPGFASAFIMQEHVHRFLASPGHREPIWFFVLLTPLALSPWSMLPLLDWSLWRGDLTPRRWSSATRFLVLWAATTVAFFSFSSSKLLPYILPALPPLSILVARSYTRALERGALRFLGRGSLLCIAGGTGTALAAAILPLVAHHWRIPLVRPYLFAGAAALFVTGVVMHRAVAGDRALQALGCFTAGSIALLGVVIGGRGLATSYRELGHAAAMAARPGDRLAVYAHFIPGIVFYAGQRVVSIRYWGNLGFGHEHADAGGYFWETDDDLRAAWAAPGRVLLVIDRDELERLQPPLDPAPVPIFSEGKKVLVANRPARS